MRHFIPLLAALLPCTVVAQENVRPIAPSVAAQRIDEKVVVQMEVKSTGGNTARYLNSAVDFRDAGNFAIYIPSTFVEKFKQAVMQDPAVYYKGKTIQVTGVVTLAEQKPQLKATDPAQIKVIPRDTDGPPPKRPGKTINGKRGNQK